MTIRILLADDHRIVLAGLYSLLETEADMEVVGEVRDGREAVHQAREKRPDVVVMDIAMPGLNGIEATRQISSELPRIRVLCLSMHSERQFVSAVLEAGAAGFLLKDRAADELIRGIRTVAKGQTFLCPVLAGKLVDDYRAHLAADHQAETPPLTPREREVLQLIAEGHATRDIAERLAVSVKTIGTHREHIMQKLDVHSVAGLTKYAIRHGLTTAGRDSPSREPTG